MGGTREEILKVIREVVAPIHVILPGEPGAERQHIMTVPVDDQTSLQFFVTYNPFRPMTQAEIAPQRRGHAIEVRLNAENPAGGKFLPSPGTITTFDRPDGFGVRVDAGYAAGETISQYYDNLIAKLICWGKDRETAIAKTIRALEELRIVGVHTTVPADLAILRHPDFHDAKHSTKWVEDKLDLSAMTSSTGVDTGTPATETEPARVRAMYTSPDFTRRGIGRLVLSLCEDAARREGFTTVELGATLGGKPLYEACGYKPIELMMVPTPNGVEVPVLRMGKLI